MLWVLVAVLAFALLVAIGYCISVTRERDDFQGLYDAKCKERQDTQYALDDTQKQLDGALEDLSKSRALGDTYWERAGRAIKERDAYKRGLIDVTNLGTRKMAHIGKRMVAAANEALKTGAEL